MKEFMDIEALKASIKQVMPILANNLSLAYAEYMEGAIPRGAYEYVLSRHGTAAAVVSRDDIEPEQAFRACAALAIDLRSGVRTMPAEFAGGEKVEAFWQCYRDAGFLEVHPVLNVPTMADGLVRG